MAMNPRLLRPLATGGFDADAQTYITAVQAADGQALEQGVKVAINDFVVGCKSDGIWDSIKASCILAGARTLAGALVPLKGAAPTNQGPFVAADYVRATGLKGNESTKYLDSNYLATSDPQDDHHLACTVTELSAVSSAVLRFMAGVGANVTGASHVASRTSDGLSVFRNNAQTNTTAASGLSSPGFVGHSRSSSASFDLRAAGSTASSGAIASQTQIAGNHFVFGTNNSGLTSPTGHRLAFYSIGTSLDLEALDTRVSALITAIGAAV